ncbi:MAG TPA: hypothetical protein VJU14_11025 [Solirubrobacterales bacterium]|nr:hypothetical protein [Solirubrobacterales bacterium]
MKLRDDFAEILRTCSSEAEDWHSVESCFRKNIDEDDPDVVEDARPIVWAFGYMLVASRREETRERYGVFGAAWEIEGSIFPPPLAELPDEVLEIWIKYADALNGSPFAISRLNDLLWVRKFSDDRVTFARAAIDAYLEVAASADSMTSVDALLRAIEIGSEIKDEVRLPTAVGKAVEAIEEELAIQDEFRPGIPMNLLEALVDLKPEVRPASLRDLVEMAGERYGSDPYNAQSVGELLVQLAPMEDREGLQRQQVTRWKQEADRSTGILRYSRLQEALGLARKHGFTDMAEELLVAMQSMTDDDLELKTISTEVKVPREKIDAYVRGFIEKSSSWQEALTRFGASGPPSGNSAKNLESVREMARKHPLSRLVSNQVIGAHNSPTASPESEEEHDRLDLAGHEALAIRVWAPLGVEILESIKEKFGEPDRQELADFFTTELIDKAVAARFADSVLRFYGSDDDGALHILAPQIEAAIRGTAARIGIVVIKTPKGPTPGGVRALGAILSECEGRMDESWRRYLLNALADQVGVNLRNEIGHGLYGPSVRADAAILIHIACHLRLLGREVPGGDEEAEAG